MSKRSPYELVRSGQEPRDRSGRAVGSSVTGAHAAFGPVIVLDVDRVDNADESGQGPNASERD